jgi:hypothetical protein
MRPVDGKSAAESPQKIVDMPDQCRYNTARIVPAALLGQILVTVQMTGITPNFPVRRQLAQFPAGAVVK